MANLEIQESNSRPDRIGAATYASLAASSWNANDMRSLFNQSQPANDITALFGNLDLFAGPTEAQDGYIGVYKPGASPVSEKPENKDSAKPWELPAAPEAAQLGGVIADSGNQARWQRAQEVHKLGQDESATDLYGTTKQAAQKFELFDSNAKKEEPAAVVAWDPREWANQRAKDVEHGVTKAGKSLESTAEKVNHIKETVDNKELQHVEPVALGQDPRYPHRGHEDDHISYGACAGANNPFENLRMRIGSGPGHIDHDLIAGIMRNEQFFYKNIWDTGPDNYVRNHGNLDVQDNTSSIGPAQMQVRNIQNLMKQFPEQLAPYAKDPLRAALSPGDAPMFVAAYLSNMIEHLEKHTNPGLSPGVWKNIQKHWSEGDANGALILAFNPDPHQIENVSTQLQAIKQERAKKSESAQ